MAGPATTSSGAAPPLRSVAQPANASAATPHIHIEPRVISFSSLASALNEPEAQRFRPPRQIRAPAAQRDAHLA
jgi:hypothetical protein